VLYEASQILLAWEERHAIALLAIRATAGKGSLAIRDFWDDLHELGRPYEAAFLYALRVADSPYAVPARA
jgi:hypothetical protein